MTLFAVSVPLPARALDPNLPLNQYGRMVWTAENGLPSAVYAIAQDSAGYLWLGTDTGLIRFDGTDFVPWGTHGETALAGIRVETILAARDGTLWVGFGRSGGISRIRNGQVLEHPKPDSSPHGYILALLEDRDGVIWAGGLEGVALFRSNRWEHLGETDGLPDAAVQSLYEGPHGDIWIGTALGVFRRAPGAAVFQRVSGHPGRSFTADSEGQVWVTDSTSGLRPIGNRAAAPGTDLRVAAPGLRLLTDHGGTLWVGTRGFGLWRAHIDRPTNASQVERLTGDEWLTDAIVLDIFEDRHGSLWIGTMRGLARLSDNYVRMITSRNGLPNGPLQAVAVTPDGAVWIATRHGLHKLSEPRPGEVSIRRELDGVVTALHTDRQGRLLIAAERGIYRFGNGRILSTPLVPRLLNTDAFQIAAIVADHSDGIWLCDEYHGLLRWWRGILERHESVPEVKRNPCSSAHVDATGRLWFGFRNGTVASYHRGAFEVVKAAVGVVRGDTAISGGRDGAVWISSPDGVNRFLDERLETVATRDRLPGAPGAVIVEDGEGHVWTATTLGLMQLKVKSLASARVEMTGAKLFDASDGLLSRLNAYVVGSPAAARSNDGRLWFATANGLAVIDPKRLPGPTQPSQVWFETVTIDDRTVLPQAEFSLRPGTQKLEIKYGALNLTAPGKLHFRYRLEGFDEGWIEAGTRRQAFYMNLPPRTYRFRVMASDTEGGWTGAASELAFTLRPVFYQTRWFYLECALGGTLTVCGLWWLRLRILKRQFAVVLAERARVGREIHDTLLQSLSSFTVEVEVIATQLRSAPEQALDSLQRLRTQVAECIRETRESIWNLRSQRYTDADFVTALRKSAEYLTAGRGVQLRFSLKGRPRPCPAAVEEQLLRISQEALNNAVRHGRPTTTTVELEYEADSVFLRVSDDGQGFDVERQLGELDGHVGLLSMRERAALVGGSFVVTSAVGKGTQVETVVSFSPAAASLT